MPKPLSWKPVRRGALYCAPACGGGCTWAAYGEAHRKGNELARRLGPGWSPNVWENLGWHYSATAAGGLVAVHEYGRRRFTAYMLGGAYDGSTARASVMAGLRVCCEQLGEARRIARSLMGLQLLPPIAAAQRARFGRLR